MPQLITNMSERQTHPFYPNKRNTNSMTAKTRAAAIPKTYDAIKSAAGADMSQRTPGEKAKGKKC